jgi:hypothetical protein
MITRTKEKEKGSLILKIFCIFLYFTIRFHFPFFLTLCFFEFAFAFKNTTYTSHYQSYNNIFLNISQKRYRCPL